MKVILIEDIQNLGTQGEIVEVSDGHARNFLFPKKLAKPATKENLLLVEAFKKRKIARLEKEKKDAESLRDRLSTISCTIPVKAGPDDKLYGSVTSQDIAMAFETEGINIDKNKVILEEPIKTLGVYHVLIKVCPDVETRVKIWVVKE